MVRLASSVRFWMRGSVLVVTVPALSLSWSTTPPGPVTRSTPLPSCVATAFRLAAVWRVCAAAVSTDLSDTPACLTSAGTSSLPAPNCA